MHRWFSGRIIACHAIDPGSIPGRCKAGEPKTLPEKRKLKFFSFFLLFHCQKRGNYQNIQVSSKPDFDSRPLQIRKAEKFCQKSANLNFCNFSLFHCQKRENY